MELLVSETNPETRRAGWLWAHALLVFAFLYLPIAVLIIYSFNGPGVGGFPPRDLTLDWYRTLFADGAIWQSVVNSLVVAAAAAGDHARNQRRLHDHLRFLTRGDCSVVSTAHTCGSIPGDRY